MSKIIWAVDPEQNPKQAKKLIEEMRVWSKKLNCDVQPVAIFPDLTLPKASVQWRAEILKAANQTVEEITKKTGTEDFLTPVKKFVPYLSTRKMALALIQYAEESKAEMICCNTQAKSRWNPFRLGSFAETLVSASRIPVLLLNPKARTSPKISRVLFPTDFTQDAKNALTNFKPWAKMLNSRLILYNQVDFPSVYTPDFHSSWQTMGLPVVTKELEKIRKAKAKKWVAHLKADNISASAIVELQKTFIADAILGAAKKNKADLIVMVSRSGQVVQAIVGSIARDVLQNANCPVLVYYRPTAPKRVRTKKSQEYKKTAVPEIVYHERP